MDLLVLAADIQEEFLHIEVARLADQRMPPHDGVLAALDWLEQRRRWAVLLASSA